MRTGVPPPCDVTIGTDHVWEHRGKVRKIFTGPLPASAATWAAN